MRKVELRRRDLDLGGRRRDPPWRYLRDPAVQRLSGLPRTAEVELAFILCEQRDRGGLVIPVITRTTDLGMLERFRTIDARNRSAQWIAARLADAVMMYSASEAGS